VEIEAAAKAMFVRICTNIDPEQTWSEIVLMPQHAPVVAFYRAHAWAALKAAEDERERSVKRDIARSFRPILSSNA
jgi:hypothetical protein